MRVSVVVPILNEEGNVPRLYARVRGELEKISPDFELIFVDDGSTDRSAAAVADLHASDPRVKLVSFSRNFGYQMALTAGLDHSSGDAVVIMDGDLQHPPSLLPALLEKWQEGFEVVHTIRRSTADASGLRRTAGDAFYSLFRRLSRIDLPANTADFRLLDRKVVRALGDIRERTRFLAGLTVWTGFRSTSVTYEAPAREEGVTKFTGARIARLALDALVSFSTVPLHLAVYVGTILAALGFLYSLYALWERFASGTVLPGWTSIVMLVAIVGGIQLMLIGVLGVYLGKIYEEVKQRPLYVVRASIGLGERPVEKT